MQDKKRVENFWREPPRGLFIHFVLLIKKRRLKSSQKSLTFWGHYSEAAGDLATFRKFLVFEYSFPIKENNILIKRSNILRILHLSIKNTIVYNKNTKD